MNLIKLERQLCRFKNHFRPASTLPSAEYTEYPEYPPVEDLSYEAKKRKQTQSWADQVQQCKTVEEKQMKLNMPKYYGWKCINFNDVLIPYNSLPLVQHCTRTCFKEALPTAYDSINVDSAAEQIKSLIEDAILFENDILKSFDINKTNLTPFQRENLLTESIVKQINRIILNNSAEVTHLKESQVDLEPRHEAFWFIGGLDPPENCRKSREKQLWMKDLANQPINRTAQYLGTPTLALRTKLPLEPIVPFTETTDATYDVPLYTFDPRVVGFGHVYRHGTNIPGFWPGDAHEFGQLSYQSRSHILNRSPTFGDQDNQEALDCQGVLSSFAWGLSQASYQGFTTYNDLTYPLVMQTIITNGQDWSFYTYQLNTTVFHSQFISENPKKNICWGTKSQKLYQEINNGTLVGFNIDVLKNLLKFYHNQPKAREGVDMKPYLDKTEQTVALITDTDKREWLEPQYKHMMSNRPKHLPMYEIYHWEKIYKIDNKTRAMEPRRRPFELNIDPWKRRYDERSASYIPKVLRPGGPKSKPKFYKSYFP